MWGSLENQQNGRISIGKHPIKKIKALYTLQLLKLKEKSAFIFTIGSLTTEIWPLCCFSRVPQTQWSSGGGTTIVRPKNKKFTNYYFLHLFQMCTPKQDWMCIFSTLRQLFHPFWASYSYINQNFSTFFMNKWCSVCWIFPFDFALEMHFKLVLAHPKC